MQQLLHKAIIAAINAGDKILEIYNTNFSVDYKSDETPVTAADKAASNSIASELASTQIPLICEEKEVPDYDERKNWKQLWLVDPLDGTKEFVKRNGEFTVNIALIEQCRPVIGVVFSPVSKQLYFAAEGLGSYKLNQHQVIELINNQQLHNLNLIMQRATQLSNKNLPSTYTIIASRSHLSSELYHYIDVLEQKHQKINLLNVGSSIKMCWVADGLAHEYPRFGTTMEWDTAAGHCIVKQAGGNIFDLNTKIDLVYNKPNLKNPNFIARNCIS
jgi:3'(2'), 5'-bisphosphate nucleotidase